MPPPACVAFSGLTADQAAELSARVAKTGSGFKLAESRGVGTTSWWVHIPSQGNKEGADRKAAELRRLGVEGISSSSRMPAPIGLRFPRPLQNRAGRRPSSQPAA